MVSTNFYTMNIYLNDNDMNIDNYLFNDFTIYETIHFGMYHAALTFSNKTPIFKETPLMAGNKIKVSINFQDEKVSRDYNFIIHEVKEHPEIIIVILMPDIGLKLIKDDFTKGYSGKIDTIVSQIASDAGITQTEIEPVSLPTVTILQSNINNFQFIKSLIKKSKNGENGTASYIFFIDKTNKLKFYSVKYLKSKQELGTITDNFITNLEIQDTSFALQMKSGYGGRGFYFNWDTGSMTEIGIGVPELQKISSSNNNILSTKLGVVKDYVNKNNKLMMLNPIIKDLYFDEKYNSVELENEVLRKNYFNTFVIFRTFCNLDLTPAEILNLNFKSSINDTNKSLSGKWIIYEVINNFNLAEATSQVKLTNNFVYGNKNANIL